jgi:myosin I
VYQQVGERNFHSFYNLLFGASDSELKDFGLKQSDLINYSYINQGGSHIHNNMNDKQNYRLVNDAMKIANFDQNLIKTIWNIVSSIIHLGNLKFESDESDHNNNNNNNNSNQQAKLSNVSIKSIKEIAKLLKIDENGLVLALTSRTIATGHKDIVKTFLTEKEALYARDSLAKAMYDQLFSFIFSKINEILDIKNTIKSNEITSKNSTVIGVLDIYGFEIFETNGYILLLIKPMAGINNLYFYYN